MEKYNFGKNERAPAFNLNYMFDDVSDATCHS
jgi:hypothetical protein